MGYFQALANGSFKVSKTGQNLFYPWGVFGRGYIIPTDEQYQSLRKQMVAYVIVSVVVSIGAVLVVTVATNGSTSISGLVAACIAAAVLLIFFGGWMFYSLRGLETTEERLSLKESMATQARLHNPVVLWILEIVSIILLLGGVGMLFGNQWYLGLFSVVLFGYCTWVFARMILVRRNTAA